MKKIKSNPTAVLTFLFLFSGSIIFNLYYTSGNPIVCFLVTSAVLLAVAVFLETISKIRKSKSFPRFFRVIFTVIAFVCLYFNVLTYADSLGTFADYYARLSVLVFAGFSVVASGYFAAKQGNNALTGFASMTAVAMISWTFAGFLGFFHTRRLVPVEFSSLNITSDNIVEIIKAVLFTVADIVLVFFAVENGDGSKNENKAVGMMKGVISFALLCGINVGKNVFMFGSDFLSGLENPDLAAIRLIPMFELPEISVIVNTFAVNMRSMLYIRVILCCTGRKNRYVTDCDRFFTLRFI